MAAFWLAQAGSLDNKIGSAGAELFEYVKMIAILGLILAAVFVGLRVWLPRMAGMRKVAAGPIRVAARLALEPRKNLYIVQAGGDYFLVGTSESGMHYLTRLDSDRAEGAMAESEPATEREFAGLINAFKRSRRSP
jgi:flagellar biogenesis protein FliO